MGLLALGLSIGIAGCAAPPPNDPEVTTASERVELDDVDALAAELKCIEQWELLDDVHFYDAMRGFDCWLGGDGPSLSFRAYEHDASAGQVLQDWDGLVSADRPYLLGTNWFAVGSSTDLKRIADAIGVEPIAYSTLPEAPAPVSPVQTNIGMCTTVIVTAAESELVFNSDGSEAVAEYEEVFPGIGETAEQVVEDLSASGGTAADTFNYDITEFGPAMKSFCEEAVEQPQ